MISFNVVSDRKAPWNADADPLNWLRHTNHSSYGYWQKCVRAASRVREDRWLVMEFGADLNYDRVRNGLYWAARREGLKLCLRRYGSEIWAKVIGRVDA